MDRSSLSRSAAPGELELALQLPDGSPWPLRLSPGMQRFIGYYIRVEGVHCGGPLLAYRRVMSAAPRPLPVDPISSFPSRQASA